MYINILLPKLSEKQAIIIFFVSVQLGGTMVPSKEHCISNYLNYLHGSSVLVTEKVLV